MKKNNKKGNKICLNKREGKKVFFGRRLNFSLKEKKKEKKNCKNVNKKNDKFLKW